MPEDAVFSQGRILYHRDRETGALGAVREVTAEFNCGDGYRYFSLTAAERADYGENGWAGPMFEAAALTAEDVEACTRPLGRNGGGTPKTDLGVWCGEAYVALSATGLDTETVLAMLRSVPGADSQ